MTDDTIETVERVAKAIAFSAGSALDRSKDAQDFWEHTSLPTRHYWRALARAALSAMPQQEVTVKEAAKVLLGAVDAFMSGKTLTEGQRELEKAATLAGAFAAAAYDAYAPKSGGEFHALTRSFLLALIDPAHVDLDYLRAEPDAGQIARDASAALRAISEGE